MPRKCCLDVETKHNFDAARFFFLLQLFFYWKKNCSKENKSIAARKKNVTQENIFLASKNTSLGKQFYTII